MVKLERALFQKSHLYFIAFFLFMLAGFWLTYFTEILNQENYRMHTHGATLLLWCLMLIAQAYLIRIKKKSIHRQIGKLSYVLVPLILYTTVDLFKFRMRELTVLTARDYLFVASVLNALLVFLIFYGLAIYFKKKPVVHARYMLCTAFPMFTAIIDRIIMSYFSFMEPYFPVVEGPVLQVVGLTLGDVLLVGLSIWDWRSHRRLNVFPVALGVHLLYHWSVMNLYKFGFWQSFGNWFHSL